MAWEDVALMSPRVEFAVLDSAEGENVSELCRHDLLDARSGAGQSDGQRFEHAACNDLWQMDFKDHFARIPSFADRG